MDMAWLENERFVVDIKDVVPAEKCKCKTPGSNRKVCANRVIRPLFIPQICSHMHLEDEKRMNLLLLENNERKIMRITPQKRDDLIRRTMSPFVHASQCPGNCELLACKNVKILLTHMKQCRRDRKCCCPECNVVIALATAHAKQCTDKHCKAVFCDILSEKIRQKREHQRQKALKMNQNNQATSP